MPLRSSGLARTWLLLGALLFGWAPAPGIAQTDSGVPSEAPGTDDAPAAPAAELPEVPRSERRPTAAPTEEVAPSTPREPASASAEPRPSAPVGTVDPEAGVPPAPPGAAPEATLAPELPASTEHSAAPSTPLESPPRAPSPQDDAPPDSTALAHPPVTPTPAFPSVVIQAPTGDTDLIGAELQQLADTLSGGREIGDFFGLWLAFLSALVGAWVVRRFRGNFPEHGLIPATLAIAHLALRALVVGVVIAFLLRVVPARLTLVSIFALVAVAVAVGWSVRDLLPDLLAGFVLVFERRVRVGTWVGATGFFGQVERMGLRVTRLRDAQGRQVDVPNRHLVSAPVTTGGTHDQDHEVELLLTSLDSANVRAALRDAVLASPWVHPGAEPIVLRDPADPRKWRVRGRLLQASYGARFEGELLERAEALLALAPDGSSPES